MRERLPTPTWRQHRDDSNDGSGLLTFDDAVERIDELEMETGVRVTLVQRDQEVKNPNQDGRIVETNPGPGAQIEGSASVVVYIGRLVAGDGGTSGRAPPRRQPRWHGSG